jgi:hypothetical protein
MRGPMIAPFDLFAIKDGEPQWLGCAETLMKALSLAVQHGEGPYCVFSQQTGDKRLYEVTRDGTALVACESSI